MVISSGFEQIPATLIHEGTDHEHHYAAYNSPLTFRAGEAGKTVGKGVGDEKFHVAIP